MALIIPTRTFNNGLTLENIYCKINGAFCDQETISFNVSFYANKEARENNNAVLEDKSYSCKHDISSSGVNCLKQSYTHLKTLDEFIGYVDDLDTQ